MSLLMEGHPFEPSEQPLPLDRFSEYHIEPKVTKSRLRNLFNWTPATTEQQTIPISAQTADAATTVHDQNDLQKPAPIQRSQSEYSMSQRPGTRSSPRSRRYRRSSITNLLNPIPLEQAQSQASFESVIQLPTRNLIDGLSSKLGRYRTGSIARVHSVSSVVRPRSPQETRLMHHDDDVKDGSSFIDKLMVLCSYGQILQYAVEGAADRLPERVFSLSRRSTAFASDVIPGKYWVLEISDVEDQTESGPPKTSRSPWSVFASRNSDTSTSKLASLLLVFDNPEVMQTCLTNVRTEISLVDCLRPLSESSASDCVVKLSALRQSSSERMALRSSFLRFSRSSSNLLNEVSSASNADKELPSLPTSLAHQTYNPAHSVTSSSVGTKTSLERLRDIDSGSTTTATTNSLDEFTTNDSPTKLTFSSRLPLPLVDNKASTSTVQHLFAERLSSRIIHKEEELTMDRSNNLSSTNINNFSANTINQDNSGDFPQTSDGMKKGFRLSTARFSTILPLFPSPERSEKLLPARLSFSEEASTENVITDPPRPATSHASKSSTDTGLKSSYSLFPKRFAKEVKIEPLVIPETSHIPGLSYNNATDHLDLPATPAVMREPTTFNPYTKSGAKKPMALKLLSIQDSEPAQRSPAVTEDMLASNFGTSSLRPSHSPVTPSCSEVPSFDDLIIDSNFLNIIKQSNLREFQSLSSDSQIGVGRRRRSLSSLSNPQAPSAPVGPPPRGPLPAVPLQQSPAKSIESKRSSSRTGHASVKLTHYTSKRSSNSSNQSEKPISITRGRGKSFSDDNSSAALNATDCTLTEAKQATSDYFSQTSVGTVSIVHCPRIGSSSQDRQTYRHRFRNLSHRNSDTSLNHPRAKSSNNDDINNNCSGLGAMTLSKIELPNLCDIAFNLEEDNKKYDKLFANF